MLTIKLNRVISCIRKFSVTQGSKLPYIEDERLTPIGQPSTSELKTQSYNYSEEYWDQAVEWYEKYISGFTRKIYTTMIPFLRLENNCKILEVGTSTGIGVEALLENANENSQIFLTNYSKKFLELCKAKNFPRTQLQKVNNEDLVFPGESFDRYITISTIEQLENPQAVLREAFRVVKPGGILGISVLGRRTSSRAARIFAKLRSNFNLEYPFNTVNELKNPLELKNYLKECGFQRTLNFYQDCNYPSYDFQELKNLFLEEPNIKNLVQSGNHEVVNFIEEEVNKVLYVEKTTMNYEALVIMAYK